MKLASLSRTAWAQLALPIVLSLSPALAADQTGVASDTIKIGMFGPLTSSASVFAKVIYGAEAIYKDVNDRGGINGRKLELVVEDDACDPKKGLEAVTKLLDQDKIFMLHGAWCSSVALAIKPEIIKRPNVPYMVLGAGSAAISTPPVPNIFHPLTTSATVSESIVEFALTKPGASRIAIVTQPETGPQAQFQGALAKLKEHNLAPVETIVLSNNVQDATKEASALKDKSPDAVLAILYPAELGVFLRDAYRVKLHTTIVTVQGTSIADAQKRVGIRDALKDLYFFYPLSDNITSFRLSKYARLLKKYYPDETLDPISFMGMGGALATVEALNRLGKNVTREGFIAELDKINNFETDILSGPITFSPSNHAGVKTGKMITLVGSRELVVSRYPSGQPR
jgi:branched-chain amino acid transport system substrate-binding protein